jgi:hypothetical protein
MKKTRPSHFTNYPWSSVKQKSEWESIAQNIMRVMSEHGNDFSIGLSLEQYTAYREKEGGSVRISQESFDELMEYCKSAETAKLFSKDWKDGVHMEVFGNDEKTSNEDHNSREISVVMTVGNRGLIEAALNHYWNDANANLQRSDLGDLERFMYEKTKTSTKELLMVIDLNWYL